MTYAHDSLYVLQAVDSGVQVIHINLSANSVELLEAISVNATGIAFDGEYLCLSTPDEGMLRVSTDTYETVYTTETMNLSGVLAHAGTLFFSIGDVVESDEGIEAGIRSFDAVDLGEARLVSTVPLPVNGQTISGIAATDDTFWIVTTAVDDAVTSVVAEGFPID